MAEDYFDAKLALNPETGNVVASAQALVYSAEDITFTTPLEITDMTDIPLANLVASPTGIYPPFKVTSGVQNVLAKSGTMITPLTSVEGSRGDPGEPGPAGIGVPDPTALPDGYVLVVQGGEWEASPSGGGGGGSGRAFYYTGSTWQARPSGSDPAMAISTKYPGAPQPSSLVVGDMWVRHPNDLEGL